MHTLISHLFNLSRSGWKNFTANCHLVPVSRQVTLILKTGYDPNLLVNARGQNGLQYMINHFGATDAHFRLQAPINKAAYLSIGKLLLDSGLDPNAPDLLSGETVIFDAIRFNDKDMVSLLLSYVSASIILIMTIIIQLPREAVAARFVSLTWPTKASRHSNLSLTFHPLQTTLT